MAFYQTGTTTGDGTPYVSPAPLAGYADVVEEAAFHLNDPAQFPILTLKDDAPSAAKYAPMWRDVAALQAKGVKVTALLGGAASGTYTRLDADFDMYYSPIRDALRTHELDGVDCPARSSAGPQHVAEDRRHAGHTVVPASGPGQVSPSRRP
ncbi:hypothetical protein ACFV2Q_31500 [Streptomyces sp. NPDC059650]|uniref:hypothetical protein n=1 Tax=Streptomyces sp. NPDC059650 TaxID=3346896 RepID=UPI0036AE6AE4